MGGFGNFSGQLDKSLDNAIASNRSFQVNDLAGRRQGPTILTASQTILTIAADAPPTRQPLTALGPEIATDGFTRITLWGHLDIGVMTGIRFACYGRHTTGGINHSMPIYNPSVLALPYTINFAKEEVKYADEGYDIDFSLTWDIANTYPFIIFGCGATADPGGGDDAVLTNVNVTYGWGS